MWVFLNINHGIVITLLCSERINLNLAFLELISQERHSAFTSILSGRINHINTIYTLHLLRMEPQMDQPLALHYYIGLCVFCNKVTRRVKYCT